MANIKLLIYILFAANGNFPHLAVESEHTSQPLETLFVFQSHWLPNQVTFERFTHVKVETAENDF